MLKRFTYTALHSFSKHIFLKIGCTVEDAQIAADSLLSADVRGVDSHGIARLASYIQAWEMKRVNTKPEIKITHETPSTAAVTGDSGLGLVVAPFAMQIAIEKAKISGSGWVSVKNSNHFGIAGKHAMMALSHDMIGIAMTNASPLVAPTFSAERLLGTNPIAMAVPAGAESPFVADFATSVVSKGKLEVLQRKGMDAPEGWTQTKDGAPDTDANALEKGGALLPLGGSNAHGSYKGYALSAIVDILSGILSGANYAIWVPPLSSPLPLPENTPGEGIGHFFGAMRIDAFRPATAFKKDMDQWIRKVKSAQPIEGQSRVYIPGEIERETEAERMADGIPLINPVVIDLKKIAVKFSIDAPQSIN